MAIDLTVSLTDQEQALIQTLALREAPGATPLQIKTWAEKECKKGLRAAVIDRWRAAVLEDNEVNLRNKQAQAETDFPKVN
jgi:hypothetical protein